MSNVGRDSELEDKTPDELLILAETAGCMKRDYSARLRSVVELSHNEKR
jgi:hypothetical protein